MTDNIWNDCNSLRYGFDESYDSPVFDDEDSTEEEEEQMSTFAFVSIAFACTATVMVAIIGD